MNTIMQNKGITLIELIVGVGILTFAVAGPMALAASSLKSTQDARNELIATHLAEEGLEVVHSVRDNNSAHDIPRDTTNQIWMANILSACGTAGYGCIVDVTEHGFPVWTTSALQLCTNLGCAGENVVYMNTVTGLYRQFKTAPGGDWAPSDFSRTVVVADVVHTQEVKVTSTVTYPGSRGGTRTISVTDVLYNWFPALN